MKRKGERQGKQKQKKEDLSSHTPSFLTQPCFESIDFSVNKDYIV